MEQRTTEEGLSPYRVFSREEWAERREDTPMTLTPDEVTRVRSLHDRLDMQEVEDIYLPLSRLLSLYVAATQRLFRAQQNFLGTEDAKMPYIIGVGGSVAVGKSTTARVLQALLARWPNVPKVDLVTTDGFLYPNVILERERQAEPIWRAPMPTSNNLPPPPRTTCRSRYAWWPATPSLSATATGDNWTPTPMNLSASRLTAPSECKT